jgi:Rps23 Pro-64 3,4-dihydroxylase Tpa1-like proline 4-hydroxylase
VAHSDGALLRRHIDMQRAPGVSSVRVLSGVYYLHREPKVFTGGLLRIYSLLAPGRFVDIEPVHNTLVTFPAWVPHEVLPVSCPSGDFMDSRFAVNCWLYALRPGAERVRPGLGDDIEAV